MAKNKYTSIPSLSILQSDSRWQRLVSELVGKEVIHCVSRLVSELSASHHYYDDLFPVLVSFDYLAPAYESITSRLNHDELETELREELEEVLSEVEIDDADAARDYCEQNSIEPYEQEIFEHWIVSSWLGNKLEAYGHAVLDDFLGLRIWGRATTGQAISLDSVINQICYDVWTSSDWQRNSLLEELNKA